MTPSCPSQKSWSPVWFNSFLQHQVHWLVLRNILRVQLPPLREIPLIQDPSFHRFFPGWWMVLATGLLSSLPTSIFTPSKPIFSLLSLYLGQVPLPIHLLLYPFLPPNWSFPLDPANLAINQSQNGLATHFWPLGFKVESAENSWERISCYKARDIWGK